MIVIRTALPNIMTFNEPPEASLSADLRPGWVAVSCPQCHREFACGAGGHPSSVCWCASFAPVVPQVTQHGAQTGCLCPGCLRDLATAQRSGINADDGTPNQGVCAGQVTVSFAPALQRHVSCLPQQVVAGTLAGVLASALQAAPALRHYILDDQDHIRKHVAVFIDDQLWRHRDDLSVPLNAGQRVYVAQALSGG